LANSAFFGTPRQTSTVQDAVAYLGVDLLKSLSLAAGVFFSLDHAEAGRELADTLQKRAVSVARLAKRLCPDPKLADLAFTAGLLHNLGMMLFALKVPERAKRIVSVAAETGKPWHLVETEEGQGHAALGAYLLGAWGLPLELVEAVAYQHCPSNAPQRCPLEPLATIHVATTLVESLCAGDRDPLARVDKALAARAGILEKLPYYLSIARDEALWAREAYA
jgi:HD-like signal output (HDOD) protein